jgi:dUTP pyrophosphatase
MDLCTTEAFTLELGEQRTVATGIALAIPVGYVGLVWEKSGLAMKQNIKTKGGVIDAGYRGEVFVGLCNFSNESQSFAVGDKVAQLLIQKINQPDVIEVEELDETARGEGRFGSTGR